ncbi:ABC transporter permease subunit [Candidatus Saccharibacteria bacterium]|nr:ABC transporter permease subunit [Candidatus Saccharibacteria bacterium]
MYNLFTKTIYDKRAFIIGWSIGLAFIGYLMTIFYPAFHQDNALDQLVESLPPALQGLVGNLNNLKELPTYLGSQLFDIRIPIFISILTIILASGLTVGEEEKGQLRTLIALPLSRTRILLTKWITILVICFVVTLATIAGIELGLAVIGESLDWLVLVRLGGMMWLLAVTIATMIFSIGLSTGKKGVTTGLGVLFTVGSFLLTTFATSVDWLQPYETVSLLHYFAATDIAKNAINIGDVLVYAGIIVVFLLIAVLSFRRRDVR